MKYLAGVLYSAVLLFGQVLYAEEFEKGHSFPINTPDFLHHIIKPFEYHPKTISFVTSDSLWNTFFLDYKIDKLKSEFIPGIDPKTFIIKETYSNKVFRIPIVVHFKWYTKEKFKRNYIDEFRNKVVKKITDIKVDTGPRGAGKSWKIVDTSIAGKDVSLSIKGGIDMSGKIIFQDQEKTQTSFQEGKTWDLDFEQQQKFDIEGNIGNISILVKQNSESTFSWENDMLIKYEADEDRILQSLEAGNINLSLTGTKFVNQSGSKSEGLFGIKSKHQLGPLSITTIASREQVKKSKVDLPVGGTAQEFSFDDNNFSKNFYFIDEDFKNLFYPLNSDFSHSYNPNKVIERFEVYKRTSANVSGKVYGTAYLDPATGPYENNSVTESGDWVRLVRDVDYEINQLLGYIRLITVGSTDAVGIAYTIGVRDSESQNISPSGLPPIGNIDYLQYSGEPYTDIDESGEWEEGEPFEDLNNNGIWDTEITLKLLKSDGTATASKPTWPLMLKNVYSLGSMNINPDGFEFEIVHEKGEEGIETYSPEGTSFLELFGLDTQDESGSPTPDGIIDKQFVNIIDFARGFLFFPTYLPFAYDSNPRTYLDGMPYGNGNLYWGNPNSELSDILETPLNDTDGDFSDVEDSGPAMYYSTNTQDISAEHEFILKVKSSSQRPSSLELGFLYKEGSAEVKLNGQTLIEGQDYTIDGFTGTLNFLNPDALDPTNDISVTYEENEIVSFDQKIMAGTRMQLDFSDDAFLGFTALYYNQSITDEKVDIGYEPIRNFIWDINGKYQRNFDFITRAVDWLPFIETTKPSRLLFEGEFAEVIPNPNPLGQAFIDDFESSKRTTSINLQQKLWKMASPPVNESVDDRIKMSWYNPYYEIDTKEIWPNQQTSNIAQNNTTRVLVLETFPDADSENLNSWNGVTTSLYSSDYDQSNSKYMDLWLNTEDVQNDEIVLHIDIGYISEDINNNGSLDTEDELIFGNRGNDALDEGEDSGLDGCTDEYEDGNGGCDFENPPNLDGDPNGDNWSYSEGSSDYSQINGTEGNGQSAGYTLPDTEDLNRDYSPNFRNGYFTYELRPEIDEEISYTDYDNDGNPNWKLFRILLSDFEKSDEAEVEWTEVKFVRLWANNFESYSEETIKIAKFEIVGNEWEELGVASIDSMIFTPDTTFSIAVANTEENTEYKSPPGVVVEYDEYYGVYEKEQSLVLSFKDGGIGSDSLVAIKKVIDIPASKRQNFFAYKNMEMFVSGEPEEFGGLWTDFDSAYVQMIFRFGQDDDKYYEIVKPIFEDELLTNDGWDPRNHIDIDIAGLSAYKLSITDAESFEDTGIDGCYSEYENGWGGCLDTLTFVHYLESGEVVLIDTSANPQDPNGDDYDSVENTNGDEGNLIFDCNEDICEEFEDENGNGFRDVPPDFCDEVSDICEWFENTGDSWRKVRIKGKPSIDRIEYIIVGVQNHSNQKIYGQVLIDELRMTEVKREKGRAMRFYGMLEMADLASITSSFERTDAEFHRLQEHLGNGSTSEKYSINTKFNPNLFLPSSWGIKTPITVNYSSNVTSPKYKPGSDILLGSISEAPDSAKTKSSTVSVSTSLSKTSRSDNWLPKYTLDRLTIHLSAIHSFSSNTQIRNKFKQDHKGDISYSYSFSNENYWRPFSFMKKVPLIGEVISDSRIYWSPKKWSTKLTLKDYNEIEEQRAGTITERPSFKMTRNFSLTQQYTKSISSTYTKNIESDLIDYIDHKVLFIKEKSPGTVTNISESLNNTFSPDYLKWLKPKLTYNSSYNWKLNSIVDTLRSSNVSSTNAFSASVNISPKDFIELIYKPQGSSGSSGRSGRGRGSSSSSNSNSNDEETTNPVIKFVFRPIHFLASKLSPISVNYKKNLNHTFSNVEGHPGYDFRFGLSETPNTPYHQSGIPGFSHKYIDDLSLNSGVRITTKVNTTFQFKNNSTLTIQSGGQETKTDKISFFPLGNKGENGLPFVNWGINWSGMEKLPFLNKVLKSMTISHNFTGDKTVTIQDGEEKSSDYSRIFSPLFGLTAKTKGRRPVDINFNIKHTLNISNNGSTTDRITKNSLTSKVKYSHRGGFTIPIFFFRDLPISNDISFEINSSYNDDITLRPNTVGEFVEQAHKTTWEIRPKIIYSFTKYVNGGVHFMYKYSNDLINGARYEKDFGFNVYIKIQG